MSTAAIAGAVLAVAVVLLFLGSVRRGFIIGLSIPIAILATFALMGLGNLTLNIMSLGGLALGLSAFDAVIEAGRVRFRPILMTSLTTVLGMTPLALGIGDGSELMQPLAIAVIGGLLVSMILTLLLVPSVYLIVDGIGETLTGLLTRRPPRRHERRHDEVPAPAGARARG